MSLRVLTAVLILGGLVASAHAQGTREPDPVEVAVEIRVVSVPEGFLDRFVESGNLDETTSQDDSLLFLNDDQRRRLLEAVQDEKDANVMQMPKLTLLDGQKCPLRVGEDRVFTTQETQLRNPKLILVTRKETVFVGTSLTVRPRVSADGRFLDVHVDGGLTDVDSSEATQAVPQPKPRTLKVDRSFHIPDGGTALINLGTRSRKTRQEATPPTLNKIPYVNRLFKNVASGRQIERVLMLVTARVLDSTEQEGKFTPVLPPIKDASIPASEPPSEAEVLAALPRPAAGIPDVLGVSRENVRIVCDRLVDRLDPSKFYPLVGRAQLHVTQWKCTVSWDETVTGSYPFPFRAVRPRVEVVYLDKNRLHLCPEEYLERVGIDFGPGEEQEARTFKTGSGKKHKVAELVKQYRQACAEGRTADAKKLAEDALAIDPLCFARPSKGLLRPAPQP